MLLGKAATFSGGESARVCPPPPPPQLGIVTNFKALFYAFLLTKLNTQWKGGPITIVLTL